MADSITTLDQTSNILWDAPTATSDVTLNHLAVSKIFSFKGTVEKGKSYVDGMGMAIKNTYRMIRSDFNNLYQFWQGRNGSYDKFYLPIYEQQFKLSRDIMANDSIIYIDKVALADQILLNKYIWFQDKTTGNRYVRKVTSIDTLTNEWALHLDLAIADNISKSNVVFFAKFILAHFADDDFDIEYLKKDFMQVSLLFHEIVALDTENTSIEAELYTIETPLSTGYYTSYYKDIVYNNNTYLATVLKRDRITYSLDIAEDNKLNIHILPSTFTKQNIFTEILSDIKITIQKLDMVSGAIATKYTGHISGIAMSGDVAVVTLSGKDKALDFNVPRFIYQSTCNNQLFDSKCKIASVDYSDIATVTSVSGNDISIPLTGRPAGFYTLGYVKYQGEYRFITNHTGGTSETLTLLRPFSVDVTGKSVIVYAGCDKSAPTCATKFNNITNFTGFAYIPNKNPSIWGLK